MAALIKCILPLLRSIASTAPQPLELYKRLTAGTLLDLHSHLKQILTNIDALSTEYADDSLRSRPLKDMVEEKESTQRGIEICTQLSATIRRLELAGLPNTADGTSSNQRYNVFEDFTLDDSCNLSISTTGELVSAKRFTITKSSINIAGQISNESFEKAVMVLQNHTGRLGGQPASKPMDNDERLFHDRHGPGTSLSDKHTSKFN